MRNLLKNFLLIVLIFIVVSALFSLFSNPLEKEKELSLTQLVSEINEGRIKRITIIGNELKIIYQNESKALSMKESETALSQSLVNYGVQSDKLAKVEIGRAHV